MKKKCFLSLLAISFMTCAFGQFTATEQKEIQQILGKDFNAVLGNDGQLAIVAPKSIANIKSAPRGGFKGLPTVAANATAAAYERFWVYRQSSKDVLVSKLGQERYKQLSKIMQDKGMNFQ